MIKELEKLENFLEEYMDKMIISDIEELKEKQIKSSYPYFTLSFSGIDFFGGLYKGFKRDNSGERFRWFIQEWMSKVNDKYRDEDLAELIYDSCRCGILHNAVLKNSFNISSFLYPEDNHLNYMGSDNLIYLHSKQFAEDFIKAQKKFREDFNKYKKDKIKELYSNLTKMIEENKNSKRKNFKKFVSKIKTTNITALAHSSTSHTPSEVKGTEPPEYYK